MTNPYLESGRWIRSPGSLCLVGLLAVGCNLGYDPDSVPLDSAQDTASDSIQNDEDAPGDVIADPTSPDREEVVDQAVESDPVEMDLVADTDDAATDVIESDPVEDDGDLADVVDEEIEEPDPCEPVTCMEAPAPLVHSEDYESYTEGETPCAWTGLPAAEDTPPPKVVSIIGTDGQILQQVEGSIGAEFDFVDITVPFLVEFEFRASTVGTTGTYDRFCFRSHASENCLIELGYTRVGRALGIYYVLQGATPVVTGLTNIQPSTWHRFTLLVRPYGSLDGGDFDLWFDGAFGGTSLPIPASAVPEEGIFGRMAFWQEGSTGRPPLAIDDLFITPLDCDNWTGHSNCERQRPLVRLTQAAAANLWLANVAGDTTGADDLYSGSCQVGELSGGDEVIPFSFPVQLANLKLTITQAEFDTLLYVRSSCANSDSELPNGCNDDTSDSNFLSAVELSCVEGGRYYAIIDGADAGEEGGYTLHFEGTTVGTCP